MEVYAVKPGQQHSPHIYETSEYKEWVFLRTGKKSDMHCQTQLSTPSGIFMEAWPMCRILHGILYKLESIHVRRLNLAFYMSLKIIKMLNHLEELR